MTKTTITERINAIDFATLTAEDFDFLKERALKSVRKNATKGERKPTKTQKENEGVKAEMLAVLAENTEGMTAKAIYEAMGLTSVQKASALVNQLVAEGKATKDDSGKATLFRKAD